MPHAQHSTFAALLGALLLTRCASKENDRDDPDFGSVDDAPPVESRSVRLTLWPFWDVSEDENGFTPPVPVEGVKVCVAKARPQGGAWQDFVEIQDNCTEDLTKTALGRRVVLEDVPALSELVVTASKDGYRPSVYAVTTGKERNQDKTIASATDYRDMNIQRADSRWTRVDEAVVLPDGGDLSLQVHTYNAFLGYGYLGGARVELRNAANGRLVEGSGPFYWYGGKVLPEANATVTGETIKAPEWSFTLAAGTSFVNLPEGEYRVVVTHPHAKCRTTGHYNGVVVFGYASQLNEVRAPVLAGHSTVRVEADCFCATELSMPGSGNLTCLSGDSDGGAPP